ncbi:uncharacterized protein LOC141714356 [Apium graveolens]|uniref:uncharacterized protein LOC141714356 n=1 Tax=Apium graveolens TaxID=4045 RepID=UPI003D7BF825
MKESRPQIQECKTCGKRNPVKCNKINMTCFKCNQKGHYSSECTKNSGNLELTCFKCGKVGHMAKNFKEPIQKANVLRNAGPPPPPTQIVQPRARTFNMTMKDAVQDADVAAGTLTINLVEVKVLMDSGATRSFISKNVMDRIKYVAYPLESILIIKVANEEEVVANRICPECDIVIEGMDWLANYDAQIECRNKKGKLRTKDGAEVIFKGKRQDKKFLTIIRTRILLRQGCGAYLAHVKDVDEESLKIEDIPIVKEFPDVFPNELPELPPDREIEFTINLAPGTEPVLKTPYRMAPIEMKELATQLQELLDKGVIRASVSPWGAPLSKKMAKLRRTAHKSIPGGPYRVVGFQMPDHVDVV